MGIKRKRKGPIPDFGTRWQNIATDPNREMDAVKMYRSEVPTATLAEASRMVREFRRKMKESFW